MKPVSFSRHARRRLRRHGISDWEVEVVVREPDATEPSVKGRTNAFKLVEGHMLKVTYLELGAFIMVVTVTPRRAGRT